MFKKNQRTVYLVPGKVRSQDRIFLSGQIDIRFQPADAGNAPTLKVKSRDGAFLADAPMVVIGQQYNVDSLDDLALLDGAVAANEFAEDEPLILQTRMLLVLRDGTAFCADSTVGPGCYKRIPVRAPAMERATDDSVIQALEGVV